MYNISADVREFQESENPAGSSYLPNTYATYGMPDFSNYGPPWPADAAHRYEFTLYALDATNLGLPADYEALMVAILAHTIESATLIGVYGPALTPMPTGK